MLTLLDLPIELLPIEFYCVLDTVDTQMSDRFRQPGIEKIKQLKNTHYMALQMMLLVNIQS